MFFKLHGRINGRLTACLVMAFFLSFGGCSKKGDEAGTSSERFVIQNSGSDTMVNVARIADTTKRRGCFMASPRILAVK